MTVREKTITTALIGALNRMGVGTVVLEPHELLDTDLRIRVQRNGSLAVSLEGEQRRVRTALSRGRVAVTA